MNLNNLDSGLANYLNMKYRDVWHTEFSERLFSTMEDFSTPPSIPPVDFNVNDILNNEVPHVSGVLLYTFESRSTVSRADGDGELEGHDVSE